MIYPLFALLTVKVAKGLTFMIWFWVYHCPSGRLV